MAVSSAADRRSAAAVGVPITRWLPEPDGTITLEDRRLLLGVYSGQLLATAVATVGRVRWRFVAGPWTEDPSIALTAAKNRRITWRLDDSADLGFDINGRHHQAGHIVELLSDIHAYREGELVFRGRVGSTSDDIGASSHRVNVTVGDYRAVLDGRILYSDSVLTYTAADQADIAWGLVQDTQARTAGDLGITRGVGDATGVIRDRTYEAGKRIGDALTDLGDVIDGFEWEIDPNRWLNIFYPERGTDNNVVLVLLEGSGGNLAHIARSVDPSPYGNAGRWTGDDTLVAEEREAAGLADPGQFPEGRWDVVYGQTDILEQDTLSQRADYGIEDAQVLVPSYVVVLRAGVWGGPGHVFLGDTVRLVVRSGRLNVDAGYRVKEVSVAIDDSGRETVTLTVGSMAPSFERRMPELGRRVEGLERR